MNFDLECPTDKEVTQWSPMVNFVTGIDNTDDVTHEREPVPM
jgi:hypothetical protein